MPGYIKFKEANVIPRLPLQGNLDITYRCNNNCLHCWLRVPSEDLKRKSELSTDEIKIIIDNARKLGCRSWAISGGEPMLRPDFLEIFDYITRKSSSYSLNTNGTLITSEIAELMKRKGRKMIALYGATAEVHDHVTRNPGSFQATMKGFQLLQEAGAEFTVQIVPMKDNYHQFEEMIALSKTLSPRWRIGASWLFLSANRDAIRNEEIKLQRLDPREVIELDKPQVSDEESGTDKCDCFSKDTSLFASCINIRREFHVDPYGDMSFCCSVKDPSLRYDLRKGSFSDCWEKFIPSLKGLVKGDQEYMNNCGSCSLRSHCSWCPVYGYLEHGRYSAPVEYLCQVARERKKFKDDWRRNHIRYFRCADITIKIESDLPITDKTFHPTFYLFQTDKPKENIISISRHYKTQSIVKDLGEVVYQKKNWEVYKKQDSWIYLNYFGENEKPKTVAFFNEDHTKANIYSTDVVNGTNINLDNLHDIFFSQISLGHSLADRGGFFLHSSGVIIGGKGILFVGHSGAGKTTLRNMALLKKEIKPLCNDRNIVRKCLDGYRTYGVWAYCDFYEVQASSAPLGAIMFLEQAKENTVIPIQNKTEIIKNLLPCIIRPFESKEWWDKTLTTVNDISREVPFYRIKFDLTGKIIDQIEDVCHW